MEIPGCFVSRTKVSASLLALLLCGGCAENKATLTIPTAFDASQAESLLAAGTNRLSGHAQVSFHEGGTATCAGWPVFLIPATQYALERMQAVFEGEEVVFYPRVGAKNDVRFEPDDPEFSRLRKTVTCDSNGNFEFTALADGEFVVGTTVYWQVKESLHSAAFMRQIKLAGGMNEEVVFAQGKYRDGYEPPPFRPKPF